MLHPSDLVEFDELVSPHEVAALHERAVQDGPNEGKDIAIQAHAHNDCHDFELTTYIQR